MGRTERPIRLDVAAGNLLVLIARHQDRPCPTDAEIRDWTGVARTKVRAFLVRLAANGVIEFERRGRPPQRRRLRAAGGVWTDWTARKPYGSRPVTKGDSR